MEIGKHFNKELQLIRRRPRIQEKKFNSGLIGKKILNIASFWGLVRYDPWREWGKALSLYRKLVT